MSSIAQHLLSINAIKLSPNHPFTWASGMLSPIYCDNRKALSFPPTRSLIRDEFVAAAKKMQPFNMVAGVATAGIPWGALIADALDLPFIYVRDKPKSHGLSNRIEGDLRGNERVLVVEDLISTGGSSLEAVEVLRTRGCSVAGVLAIFSYEFPVATARFAEAECPLLTLCGYAALLEQAVKIGYIQADTLDTLNAWRENPKEWAF
ncbi:MAG: hypothetical protein RI894_2288 [Bacteroidota bacterium]|jgi:orotate phosphoribosyltransferase